MPSRNKSGIHYGKLFIAFLAAILLSNQISSWFESEEIDPRAQQYSELLIADINSTIRSIDKSIDFAKNNVKEEKSIKSIVEAGNWSSPKDTVIFHLVKMKDLSPIKYTNKALQVGMYKEYNALIPDSVLVEIISYQDLLKEGKNVEGIPSDFKAYITEAWNENPSTNYYNSKDFKAALAKNSSVLKSDQSVLNTQKEALVNCKRALTSYVQELKAAEDN